MGPGAPPGIATLVCAPGELACPLPRGGWPRPQPPGVTFNQSHRCPPPPPLPSPPRSFDDHLKTDYGLVPDGFVYLRASPDTCMHRLRKR